MPQIAQQDYIFIPILNSGEIIEEIPQEIQNRLVQLAIDGRALDVVLCEVNPTDSGYTSYLKILTSSYLHSQNLASFGVYDYANGELKDITVYYREITDEPEPDAQ